MTEKIREEFISNWIRAAREDNGVWLRNTLQQSDAALDSLIGSMTAALRCIEVEEPDPEDPDWDPNFALQWQAYGEGRDDDDLSVGVYLLGDDYVALFGEYDGFDAINLSELVGNLSFEHIIVETAGRLEIEEMIRAVGHVEDTLGLGAPPVWSDTPLVLVWNKNGNCFEARLDGGILDEAIRGT